jgi:PAS domain S-box-containing protein
MLQTTKFGKYRDWRMVSLAGVLGFAVTLVGMGIIGSYSALLTSLSTALAAVAGALFGMLVVGWLSAWRVRQKLSEQNMQLDGALKNMCQGLCMFNGEHRLAVWNERYLSMYRIDPSRIRAGCAIRELLDARAAAGTFPLDPERYAADLRAAIAQGKSFTLNTELPDGRVIAVVNQPMADGGWVATHEDVTERTRAEHELERTRSFLDTIIENVPSPIIVKAVPGQRYVLINRAAEKYLGVGRKTMFGKTSAEVMPKASADAIEAEDRKLIASGQTAFLDEHAIVTPGNGTRIVTATRLPAVGNDGKLQYLIA